MAIADLLFICVIGILAILATAAIFIWRGIVWLSFVSGVMWMLLGFFFITRTQQGTELLTFQEYIQVIFLGIGIAMFFSPMWIKQKQMDLERNSPNDVHIWGKEPEEDLREFGIKSKEKKKELK
ncbi:MAG: hypothetical protein WC516_08770 [Patescibacteria group bacterium]|jgi:hypothetical protein